MKNTAEVYLAGAATKAIHRANVKIRLRSVVT